jgi:tRNA modification GTPase
MIDGFNDTIIALASAYGVSVRSVIRMSGKNSLKALGQIFEPAPLAESRPYILDGNITIWGEQRKIPSTLYYWSDKRGYTGEKSVEIHTVGSPPIFEALIDAICKTGLVRLATAGEFTLRAFLNGRIDLTQAEAVLGVIDANSNKTLEFALQQLAGGIATPLAKLRETLLNTLTQLEAGFDFADEDIEFISRDEIKQILTNSIADLENLQNQIGLRNVAGERPKVAIIGLPNAGKSSLFNALLNKNCAIVSEQAGTTRDYLEAETNFNNVEIALIDTAGIDDIFNDKNFNVNIKSTDKNNFADNSIDAIAQNFSQKIIELADVIIFCVDSEKLSSGIFVTKNREFDLTDLLDQKIRDRAVIALTKCDLLDDNLREMSTNNLSQKLRNDFTFVSSLSNYGIGNLIDAVVNKLQSNENIAIIGTASRCRESIHAAYNALNNAINIKIQDDSLIAAEIHTAINSLGLIDGTIHAEDILARIFERFCIGK